MKKWHYLIGGILFYLICIWLIAYIEQQATNGNIKSIGEALWFAIVTLTTVGYGDLYPVTPLGKVIGLLLILGSIGVLGFLIGEITNKIREYMEKKIHGFWGTKFEQHYIIVGYDDFAGLVAEQILNTGHKVAFLSHNENDLELIKSRFQEKNCFCLFADLKDKENLKKLNIAKAKSIYINFNKDDQILVYALNTKKQIPHIDIVALCHNPELKETFFNAGIKHCILPNEFTSKLVASYIFEPEVTTYTEGLIATSKSEEDVDIQQYRITTQSIYLQKTFMEVFGGLKSDYNAIVIGIVHRGKIHKNPAAEYVLKEEDYLILISNGASKIKLEQLFQVKEGR